jgi:hypothetical protein
VLWGLDAEGNFLTGPKDAVSLYEQVRNKLFKKEEVNVKEAVLMDLKRIHDAAREEGNALKEAHAPKYEIGKKLLFLFQCDLLPGISGKILELKGSRDSSKVKHVSFRAKVAAWAFLFLMDAGMLFYILLFALTQTGPRQNAWFQSFALWLVVEILLVSTAIVFITHILVPSLIMKDITQIKRRLMDNIRDFNDKVNATGDKATSVTSAEGAEGVSFNAANYLFVSTRLAREFPELKESKIILQFSTPWPRQSYLHIQNVSKKYSKKFSAFTRSASILLIFFVGNFLSVPPSVQDMVVQMTSTTAIGYIVLVHVQLYEFFPALVILPALLLAGLAHFVVQSSKSDAKIKLARLFPARNKAHKVQQDPTSPAAAEKSAAYAAGDAPSISTAVVGVQPDGQVRLFGAEQASDSDFGDSGSDSEAAVRVVIASAAPGSAAHKTRRQSIQSGLDLLHVAHRHNAQRANLEKLTSSGSSSEGSGSDGTGTEEEEDEQRSSGGSSGEEDEGSQSEEDGSDREGDASGGESGSGSDKSGGDGSPSVHEAAAGTGVERRIAFIGLDCDQLHVAVGSPAAGVHTLRKHCPTRSVSSVSSGRSGSRLEAIPAAAAGASEYESSESTHSGSRSTAGSSQAASPHEEVPPTQHGASASFLPRLHAPLVPMATPDSSPASNRVPRARTYTTETSASQFSHSDESSEGYEESSEGADAAEKEPSETGGSDDTEGTVTGDDCEQDEDGGSGSGEDQEERSDEDGSHCDEHEETGDEVDLEPADLSQECGEGGEQAEGGEELLSEEDDCWSVISSLEDEVEQEGVAEMAQGDAPVVPIARRAAIVRPSSQASTARAPAAGAGASSARKAAANITTGKTAKATAAKDAAHRTTKQTMVRQRDGTTVQPKSRPTTATASTATTAAVKAAAAAAATAQKRGVTAVGRKPPNAQTTAAK